MPKPMPTVAILGPFTAPTDEERYANIDRANMLALEVWKLGAIAYCAHQATGLFFGLVPEEVFIAGHLQMALGCDAGLLVSGWRRSTHSVIEKAEMEAQGKPVFETLDELRVWLSR